MAQVLSQTIQEKLARILALKATRAGEFALPFDKTKFPLQVRGLFPDYAKLALEIGCGWGEFTRAFASQNSDTMVIAIEKKLARVISSGRDQRRERIANVRYLVLDVAWFFEKIFAFAQFDQITINFPDPWPKLRHHKHRFISAEFVAELSRLAAPDCRLTFATDNYPYAHEAMQAFEKANEWKNLNGAFCARSDIPGRPRSFFEALHRNEGAPIYFLEYLRQRTDV
jgi:tRNA (guanine-N7-)-methyltransferase